MGRERLMAIRSRRIVRNTFWSFLGTALPMLAAFVSIPLLIKGIGAARFGVLSLAWAVVGYFSLFDLGLGRAMTQLIAERLGRAEHDVVPGIAWTSMGLMAVLGVVGALTLGFLSPWLVHSVLTIPEGLQDETTTSFLLLAVSIPLVITTAGLRGILEAHERFDLVSLVRIPLGVVSYLGPLAILPFSHTLPALVASLVAARVISWVAFVLLCFRQFPGLRRRAPLAQGLLRRLLTFSGWMTVSNIAAPLLLYLGRLLLAAYVSVEALAYFAAPYDVVINLLTIPAIFVSVLFPAFTHLIQQDRAAVPELYRKSRIRLLAVMLPLSAAIFLVAKPGLAWWIGEEFASNGFRVAQWMAVGVFVNSFGHVSQALVQAHGRPDLTAKLHCAELVAYVPYAWLLVMNYGIEGAAIAWVIRVTISTVALGVMARRCIGRPLPPGAGA